MNSKVLVLGSLMKEYEQTLARSCTLLIAQTDHQRAALNSDELCDIEVVVTSGTYGLDRELMDNLPGLSLISVNGIGVDRINLEESARRNIQISTTDDVLADPVADLAIGIISTARHLVAAD